MPVSDEILDVVDADDRVIGTEARGRVHALGLMHRAVHILVFDQRGQLFVQKRSLSKDENPGLWDTSAAGHVDSGEDYLSCARREIGEELGIPAGTPLEVLFKLPASDKTGYEHCMVYRCFFDGPLRLQADEIEDGLWLEPAQMDRRVAAVDATLTGVLRLIWKCYREFA